MNRVCGSVQDSFFYWGGWVKLFYQHYMLCTHLGGRGLILYNYVVRFGGWGMKTQAGGWGPTV